MTTHLLTQLVGVLVAIFASLTAVAQAPWMVVVQDGECITEIALAAYSLHLRGTVAYQGPVMVEGKENWKPSHTYSGVPIRIVLDAVGGLAEGEMVTVIATDGWYKVLPYDVVYGKTACGTPILAMFRDGAAADWKEAPMLIFLPEDERFSNDDMLEAFGPELAHYYADHPSTTGFMVKNVASLIVNYDGGALPQLSRESAAKKAAELAPGIVLTVLKGGIEIRYTMPDLEQLDLVTAPGTFTNSAGVDYTAIYTGVPLMTLVGNLPSDATVRVTASDGYSMNYRVSMLADRSEGTWILAFRENGEYMPFDPGFLRIVQVGENNPHFTSSLSARMVERIELLGAYEEYTLLLKGAVERLFRRGELEAGIGCPCHTATVTATTKRETHRYTGLPLWRLLAYVDDDRFPSPNQGIHYNDKDFNDALAMADYTITLLAADGYSQSVTSRLVARDDRFIVAFKQDGVFLDPRKDGYMRFVYDDSVKLPEGMRLKPVKFLVEIVLSL